MERRSFLRGAFGFVALATLCVAGTGSRVAAPSGFVTPEVSNPEVAHGPIVRDGIELVSKQGTVQAWYGETHLFDVDALGAELVRLADGTLSIDEIASAAGTDVRPADVASFFVALGQAGYLTNAVYVNLVETVA
ncbi:MAG: hypothetical protein IKG18_16435 [Atopobiaceae bacterium]|nr:hypothetical protein [Atopobiaceae bacterium]